MKFLSSADAEQAFYDAFETGDIDAMMSVWAKKDDIMCIHPQGPRLIGRGAIESSWRDILQSSMGMRVQRSDLRAFADQALTVHVLYENIWVPGETAPRPPLLATNAYRYSKLGWHMVLHHAAPVPYGDQEETGPAIFH